MRKLNRKGVALLVVAIMVVLAVPMTLVYLNFGTSQKEQSMKFDSVLKVEQVTLSGINAGFAKLKGGDSLGYTNLSGEISGDDRYDLNLTPSGKGFFQQDIYLLLSKSKDNRGKYNSIIMTDAEQFPRDDNGEVNVITHDYWATEEPYEIGVVADVISMRNSRGKDQLRYLDVKKYEMETPPDKFAEDMKRLGSKLPADISKNWNEVVTSLSNDKIGVGTGDNADVAFIGVTEPVNDNNKITKGGNVTVTVVDDNTLNIINSDIGNKDVGAGLGAIKEGIVGSTNSKAEDKKNTDIYKDTPFEGYTYSTPKKSDSGNAKGGAKDTFKEEGHLDNKEGVIGDLGGTTPLTN